MSKELEALSTIRKNLSNKTLRFNLVELLDIIESALQRLEAIENAKPSEALETLKDMLIGNGVNGNINDYVDNLILPIKQALLKAQEQERKLDRVEKLTLLLFKERRKIGQEYVKWCKENNTVFNDETNMITWALCIKLKEVLDNE